MENKTSIQVTEDLHQSVEYGKHMERIGWKVFQIPSHKSKTSKIKIFVRKLGPFAIAKMQRFYGQPDWVYLEEFLKKHNIFMLKSEPLENQGEWQQHGYRQDRGPLLGTKTLRIDLRPNETEIVESFKKDARYTLRKLQTLNPKIQINDYELFYEIWQKSAKRKRLWIPSRKDYLAIVESFGENCFALNIDNQAGTLILMNKKTAFYYYAGATKMGTGLDLPYLVVWEGMKEAKRRGCITWDFEGIFDSRWPNKAWKGFSHFKKSFGGEEVNFPGCFVKWRLPF